MNIPCKDCILLGVCKHKHYGRLIYDCYLIGSALYARERTGSRRGVLVSRKANFFHLIAELDELMGTTHWKRLVGISEGGRYIR